MNIVFRSVSRTPATWGIVTALLGGTLWAGAHTMPTGPENSLSSEEKVTQFIQERVRITPPYYVSDYDGSLGTVDFFKVNNNDRDYLWHVVGLFGRYSLGGELGYRHVFPARDPYHDIFIGFYSHVGFIGLPKESEETKENVLPPHRLGCRWSLGVELSHAGFFQLTGNGYGTWYIAGKQPMSDFIEEGVGYSVRCSFYPMKKVKRFVGQINPFLVAANTKITETVKGKQQDSRRVWNGGVGVQWSYHPKSHQFELKLIWDERNVHKRWPTPQLGLQLNFAGIDPETTSFQGRLRRPAEGYMPYYALPQKKPAKIERTEDVVESDSGEESEGEEGLGQQRGLLS